jgi:glucose-1-phosphate adenylyltransferase
MSSVVKDMLGVVLGGGKGTRLFPLTLVRSKPAVPLGGKYRLIDIPISNCINSGINQVFVLTQYNSASLNRHINQTYRFGFFSRGFVDILAAEQTHESLSWYQGTADAVRQSLRHVLAQNPKHILVLSGDQLYRMDYRRVADLHFRKDADVTICTIPVEESKAADFGILKMDNDGRIRDFYEKPHDPALIESLKVDLDVWKKVGVTAEKPLMASMGIYLFKTDVLVRLLSDETKLDFGGHVIPSALSKSRVFGYVFNGYWEDIGTIRAFYKANLEMASAAPRFNFYDVKAPIYTNPRFLPASRIQRCVVENSIISDGCVIQDSTVRDSILGIRSVLGPKTELNDSLLMGADYYDRDPSESIPIGIGEGSRIEGALIDKNVRIGRNVSIANPDGIQEAEGKNYYIREGIVIVPKNAVLEDDTVI